MKPRRTILSVPGHVEKMHRKASLSQADVVMLDLEDSVPLEAKKAARETVVRSLLSLDWQNKAVSVRMNGLDTPFGYKDLLVLATEAGDHLDSVVVPKIDHCGDIHFVDRMLNGIEMDRQSANRIGIEASIESARGLDQATDIAGASSRLKTLVFGVADYSSSIGARLVSLSGHGESEEDLYPGHRWNFVMSRLVTAAKAKDLMAIDAPYGNFKDPDGLRRAAVMSCALGFDGKWAIHPDQLEVINAVFSPTPEDIERARRVLEAYDAAVAAGRGAVAVDGRMVDQATVRLARMLWEQARHLDLV
jgi:citrate lyase subunit beta/citryl-CoA lyase/malyl-CoA/(S)-citramalyl-CoA lyase